MTDLGLKRNSKLGGAGSDTSRIYRIRSVISISQLSAVYAARDEAEGIKCIIKEFVPHGFVYRSKDGSSLRRLAGTSETQYEVLRNAFQNEGDMLEKGQHPGVVRCLDRFEQNGTAYIVMEFCEGVTLDKYIAGRKSEIDSKFLYRTILPLIETLEYLHKSGIIHRDLKPGNIMIGQDRRCKVIDFGSAVSIETDSRRPILTTAGYSPLELYSEQSDQGPMSDIYSLAAVLYFCCYGTAPTDVRKRLFNDRLEPAGTGRTKSRPFLSRAIHWGLAVSSDKRCSSLKWFKAAIRLDYLIRPLWRSHSGYKY